MSEPTFDILMGILANGTAVERHIATLDAAVKIAIDRDGGSYMSMITNEQTNEVAAFVFEGKVYTPTVHPVE